MTTNLAFSHPKTLQTVANYTSENAQKSLATVVDQITDETMNTQTNIVNKKLPNTQYKYK